MLNTAMFQCFVRRSNTTVIHVPNQIIPFICVFIIANTPTYLLVGFALGYMIIHKRTSPQLTLEDNTKEQRRIELPLSLIFNNDIQHASVNHYPPPPVHDNEASSETKTIREEDEEISNSSLEFEKLMQFPPCPTTLPRLETQFNFKADYHQEMKTSAPSHINWPAIHQELEYDRQRQQDDQPHNKKQVRPKSSLSSLFIMPNHQDMAFLSSSSSEDDDQEETRSLCSFHSNSLETTVDDDAAAAAAIIQIVEKSAPVTINSPEWLTTPLPHDDKTTNNYNAATNAAILLVENEVEENNNNEVNLFDNAIEELLLSPPAPFPPKPSFSSPGQLFKSKFQNAVKKMKKPSLPSQKKERPIVNSKRSSAYCTNSSNPSDPPVATKKKARSLQMHAYFPSPSTSSSSQSRNSISLSPRSSASTRMHDHFKVRLNKLFKN